MTFILLLVICLCLPGLSLTSGKIRDDYRDDYMNEENTRAVNGIFVPLIFMPVVTIPSIVPTIVTLFILRMGGFFGVGSEKILLLYTETTYETADVISTFTYRKGLLQSNYSYSSAIGLFNSLINLVLILSTNAISRKVSETSLW